MPWTKNWWIWKRTCKPVRTAHPTHWSPAGQAPTGLSLLQKSGRKALALWLSCLSCSWFLPLNDQTLLFISFGCDAFTKLNMTSPAPVGPSGWNQGLIWIWPSLWLPGNQEMCCENQRRRWQRGKKEGERGDVKQTRERMDRREGEKEGKTRSESGGGWRRKLAEGTWTCEMGREKGTG